MHTTSVAASSVSLAWNPSTDNVAVTGYTVYRGASPIGTTPPGTTTFTDTTVSANTTYTYTVDAFDGAGNHSAPSTGVTVTTPTASPAFVQGASDSPGTRATTATITLSAPVTRGDLLVGWFAQYDAPGQVQVSDNVNGAWTRATSETFGNGGGDLALFYVQNTLAAPNGLTITLSASAPTYLPSAAAEYSGIATTGALDATSVGKGVGTAATSGTTTAVAGGELVVGTLITGGQPLTVTPGSSNGAPLIMQVHNGSQSADVAAVLSAAAGPQSAPFTLASSMDWYAAVATFRPATSDTQPPTVPAGLHTTSVAASSVSLAWNPSTDNVAVTGYTVYRGASPIGTTPPGTTTFTDTTVSANTTYTYTVDAFDGAGNHSAPSTGVTVTTPTTQTISPAFVQGASDSPGTRATTATITLSAPVTRGDLLVGWFAQYDAPGQVQVSDNVNGAWTRATSETFGNGGGDLALFYVQNTLAAPNGLTITLSASAPTYLPSAAAEYSGIATTGALDATSVGKGVGTAATSGTTTAVAGGELVVGTLITGGQPLTVTPGSSNGAPLIMQVHNGSQSADVAAVLSAAAGPQSAPFTLASSTDWYAAAATFRPGP